MEPGLLCGGNRRTQMVDETEDPWGCLGFMVLIVVGIPIAMVLWGFFSGGA